MRALLVSLVVLCGCGVTPVDPADAGTDAGAGPPYVYRCVDTLTCTTGDPSDFVSGDFCAESETAAAVMDIDHPNTAVCKSVNCSCKPHYCTTEREHCTP